MTGYRYVVRCRACGREQTGHPETCEHCESDALTVVRQFGN